MDTHMGAQKAAALAQIPEVYSGYNGNTETLVNMNALQHTQRTHEAILDIVDPKTGKNLSEIIDDDYEATLSGDTSNRANPQSQLPGCRSFDSGNTTPPMKLNQYDHDCKEPDEALNVKKIDKHGQEAISENHQANQISSKTLDQLVKCFTDSADQQRTSNRSEKKVYDRDFLIKLQSCPSSKSRPISLPNLDIVLKDISENNHGSIVMKHNVSIGKQGSMFAGFVRPSLSPPRIKGPIMKSGRKEQPEEDHRPAVAIDNSLSIANTARPKQELVEEAKCSLVKKNSAPSDSTSELEDGRLSMEQIHVRLLHIMSDEEENSFDNICTWISVNVGKRAREPEFIRVLMTAILETSIEPNGCKWEFRPDKFQKLQALIPHYIDINIELLGLQCLIAIQEYIHNSEHPPGEITHMPENYHEYRFSFLKSKAHGFTGVLLQIVKRLWDDSIISTDALLAWERNKDPMALAVIRVLLSERRHHQKEDLKLRKTENAWKPSRLKPSETGDEEVKTKALYKRVRGVLNKLTPQKFNTLVNQVRALQIDSQERLQGVIDLVFEKAVDDPRFSAAYALMCKELAMMQVSGPDGIAGKEKSNVNFWKLVITRCQTEFEKNTVDENARAIKMKEIEACADPEKKKELQLALTEEERKMRIKSVGNVRFIGELFKQQMLTTNVMHRCIRHLLTQIDEESLECLCELLSTIGKDLESKHQPLDQYFKQMVDIVDRKVPVEISWRVRFMLQDVIELRMNKWVPRKDDSNPETMDQIQKKAQTKRLDMHMDNTPLNTPTKYDRNSDRGRNRRGEPIEKRGWSQSVRNQQQHTVETSKLKNIPPPRDNLQSGNKNMFQWSRNLSADAPKTVAPKKFAMLEDMSSEQDKRSALPLSGSGSAGPGDYGRQDYKSPYDGRHSRNGSQQLSSKSPSRDSSLHDSSRSQYMSMPPQPTKSIPPPAPGSAPGKPASTMTEEQLAKRSDNILEECLSETAHARQLSMKQIHERLLSLMSNKKENSFDNICSWISANVGARASEPQFIRVLMTAILEESIEPYNNTWKFRSDKFQNLQFLISRHIDVNIELLGLQCLIAIEEYIHKLEHPSGVLLQIIEKLWDDSILLTDAFLAWKRNKDPTAVAGKSVAMMALESFFTSLEKADDESSGEEA